jgi:hypothetical protein
VLDGPRECGEIPFYAKGIAWEALFFEDMYEDTCPPDPVYLLIDQRWESMMGNHYKTNNLPTN